MTKKALVGALFFCLLIPAFLLAEEPLQAWQFDENYQGDHQASFNRLRYEVPVLMRQTMVDMAVRLGLYFEEGWHSPLTVRFVDGSPMGVENVLAYVQMGSDEKGFFQVLNINLGAYDSQKFDLKQVYAHELVHAMLNDSMNGDAAMKIPVWFHEGLAVYGAGEGEKRVKNYVYYTASANVDIINGLEGPHGALDYAEDYLAIKYIADEKGPSTLHNLVRQVISTNGDIHGSIKYVLHEDWPTFQKNAMDYSREQIRRLGPPRKTLTGDPFE